MEISQLRTLIQVAETGSLSKAADRMNIAQPALSRQVRMLEEKLGARLFIRHGRGMVLTDQGRDVLDHVDHVMAAVADRQPDLIARWPARAFDHEAVCPTSQATPRDASGCGTHAAAQQLDRRARFRRATELGQQMPKARPAQQHTLASLRLVKHLS